ncbi:MAG TPA: nucleotidyltransferase family protein [Terracidiphilus sp.]|nr:nucleotidyltransferase family protein [Terracidiphilus sp.]
MSEKHRPNRAKSRKRSTSLKEAIVASFALDPRPALGRLKDFDEGDWLNGLWWLDTSGMTIYLYDRIREAGAGALLPRAVELAMAQRLRNNNIRMKSLLEEARTLAAWFQAGNVSYALLKGFTLTPHSVREASLRCQTDLDILVASRFADLAVHYVHRLGYRLHAQSGNTLEFRAGVSSPPDILNMYSVKAQRALELHLAKESSSEMQLLERRVARDVAGTEVYALSPADILIEQARHLLKHLCGEHTRLSWVLEFSRHLRARSGDMDFWKRAESYAAGISPGDVAMGTAVWLAEDMFGHAEAQIPPQWRTGALPVRVRLWLERYAHNLLLSDTIGNKLYGLLRKELPGDAPSRRTTFQILLPRVLPAPILQALPNESRALRWRRYRIEARFMMRRLWFHLREDIRFAVECWRWTRTLARTGK